MERVKVLRKWVWVLLACAAVLVVCIEAVEAGDRAEASAVGQPDLIRIDTLGAYGRLELPPVAFAHDRHTDALAREKQDCKTCHLVENDKMSLAFKRKNGAAKPDDIKQIYHSNCIGCHMKMGAEGKKTGPPDGLCRSCHNPDPKLASSVLDIGLNKVLHYRHSDSKQIVYGTDQKDNCGRCHHEYDKNTKKIYYAKGKEGTCRYCHLEKQVDDVKALKQASHLECVTCHQSLAEKGVKDTGPYRCAGCHGAEGQAQIAKNNKAVLAKLPDGEVPRMKREQPDAALMMPRADAEGLKAVKPPAMSPVAFNHKAHEKYNDTCRVCHHASMDPCVKCHTVSGTKEGKFIRLEEAMHLRTKSQSCVGCHDSKQSALVCAGCHNHMEKTSRPDAAACRLCHMPVPEKVMPSDKEVVLTPQQKSAIAESLLKGRNMNPGIFPIDDIPDKIQAKELANKYEPADMPHRKIILTLVNGMKDNKLAGYFHSEQGTVCLGCHHNSPISKRPPLCGSCHGKSDPRQPNRPGLLAAFHQECMECHKSMALAKPAATACTECHKEKKK